MYVGWLTGRAERAMWKMLVHVVRQLEIIVAKADQQQLLLFSNIFRSIPKHAEGLDGGAVDETLWQSPSSTSILPLRCPFFGGHTQVYINACIYIYTLYICMYICCRVNKWSTFSPLVGSISGPHFSFWAFIFYLDILLSAGRMRFLKKTNKASKKQT